MEFSYDHVEVRTRVLRQLCLEYQKTRSKELASKILCRVDRLIILTIKRQLCIHPELLDIDAEELYQTGIAGALRGASTVRRNEEARRVPARLIAYIRLELYNHHLRFICLTKRQHDYVNDETERWKYRSQLPAHMWVMIELDARMVRRKLMQAIREKKITEPEVSLFFDVYVYQQRMKDIGKKHGINRTVIMQRCYEILYRIRDLFVDDSSVYTDE